MCFANLLKTRRPSYTVDMRVFSIGKIRILIFFCFRSFVWSVVRLFHACVTHKWFGMKFTLSKGTVVTRMATAHVYTFITRRQIEIWYFWWIIINDGGSAKRKKAGTLLLVENVEGEQWASKRIEGTRSNQRKCILSIAQHSTLCRLYKVLMLT